ncbi:M28 family peptidase [Hydrogenobacter sp. T-2]|uniref:M28 family peptidase n=1 Tax=Pampinifervens diazotrophicum TaxID=1632018 RepID=UPI002B25E4FF|nr:M28 family peptidase [Hydrogenobacter sp. T-2]WPM32543.1 M28 family peptidase [Hydrogenobacter sp. T-2]
MKSERLEFFKEYAYKILTYNRLSGTEESRKTHKLVESFLEYASSKYEKETFYVRKFVPEEAQIRVGEESIKAVAYIGSKPIENKAYVKRNYIEGDIALVPDLTKEKALLAQQRGAVAIITYRSEDKADAYVHGHDMGANIPIVSIRREHVPKVEDSEVLLKVRSEERVIEGVNLFTEIGKGPVIYLVSHRDTVAGIRGAIGNGIGFLLLLFLYEELKDNYNLPYRLRFLITDCREVGMEGVRFHLRNGVKHTFYCINLEDIGWHNPVVVYKDMAGYNGERINEMFYRHLQEMRVDIDFCMVGELEGEHLPFKELGIQTLYLSSYPFTLKHTTYDNYDAISWDHVVMWHEVILSFLRRFHRL